MDRTLKKYLLINLLISASIALFFLISIFIVNPSYILQDDISNDSKPGFINPDAHHYYVMGRNLLEYGVLSRDTMKPQDNLDFHRTIGYPLILSGIRIFSKKLIFICIFHICLYLLSIYFLMKLAFLLTKNVRVAFVAGLFMSLNIASYAYLFMVMAETTFLFLIVITFYYGCVFFDAVKSNLNWKHLLYSAILVGLFTGINVIVRPATKLQIFVFIFILLFLRLHWKKKIYLSLIALAIHTMVVFPMLYRNYRQFGLWQYSSAQSITTIFWTGGTAFSLKHDINIYDAHRMIAKEYNIPSYEETLNYWCFPELDNPTNIEKKYQELLPEILFKYPKELILGAFGGIIKAHISHNSDVFAELYSISWKGGGLEKLLRGQLVMFSDNNSFLVFLFIYQYAFLAIIYAFALKGIAKILCAVRNRTLTIPSVYIFFFINALYFIAIIAMVSLYAYARFRMMLEILYYICAAHSFSINRKS